MGVNSYNNSSGPTGGSDPPMRRDRRLDLILVWMGTMHATDRFACVEFSNPDSCPRVLFNASCGGGNRGWDCLNDVISMPCITQQPGSLRPSHTSQPLRFLLVCINKRQLLLYGHEEFAYTSNYGNESIKTIKVDFHF
ncbi:unnamed protein product [Protopolystoma xenopodis]|uniref:Uncharacterized protein n=1 Tax=Protopolystoma xenopodis TaxID=117903 RepID=A0A3S5FH35_9PLAT|nr:unnamed protein product [Protopolystoma xenopodis]